MNAIRSAILNVAGWLIAVLMGVRPWWLMVGGQVVKEVKRAAKERPFTYFNLNDPADRFRKEMEDETHGRPAVEVHIAKAGEVLLRFNKPGLTVAMSPGVAAALGETLLAAAERVATGR